MKEKMYLCEQDGLQRALTMKEYEYYKKMEDEVLKMAIESGMEETKARELYELKIVKEI